jgi:hypothetical protein
MCVLKQPKLQSRNATYPHARTKLCLDAGGDVRSGFAIQPLARRYDTTAVATVVGLAGGVSPARFSFSCSADPAGQLCSTSEWAVPANVSSTSALLQFAKTHGFDFLPNKHKPRTLDVVTNKVD